MNFVFIQEVKGAKKYRHAGFVLALKFKRGIIYSNIVATKEYAWTPSSGVQDGGNCSQPDTNDAIDLEKGSGDSEEDKNHASDSEIAWLGNEGRTKKKCRTPKMVVCGVVAICPCDRGD